MQKNNTVALIKVATQQAFPFTQSLKTGVDGDRENGVSGTG